MKHEIPLFYTFFQIEKRMRRQLHSCSKIVNELKIEGKDIKIDIQSVK